MNAKCIACIALLGLLAHVQARPQVIAAGSDEGQALVERQNNPINVIPDWVSNALNGQDLTTSQPVLIPGVAATTRRPQITDVIGSGLQGLFNGIIRAPGQIVNRVQSILDQLIRRPGTGTGSTTPIPPILG